MKQIINREEDAVSPIIATIILIAITIVLVINGVRHSPETSRAKNPAFDVTPAKYVTGYITE